MPSIPWDNLKTDPDVYYDTLTFRLPIHLASPQLYLTSPSDVYSLLTYFAKSPRPFCFWPKSEITRRSMAQAKNEEMNRTAGDEVEEESSELPQYLPISNIQIAPMVKSPSTSLVSPQPKTTPPALAPDSLQPLGATTTLTSTELPSSIAPKPPAASVVPSPPTDPLLTDAHRLVQLAESAPITPETPSQSPTMELVPEPASEDQGMGMMNKDKKRKRKIGGGSRVVTRKSARVPQKRKRSEVESGDVVAKSGVEPSAKKRKKG